MLNIVFFRGEKAPVTMNFASAKTCVKWLSSFQEGGLARIEKDGVTEVVKVKEASNGTFLRYDGSCWKKLSSEQVIQLLDDPKRVQLISKMNEIRSFQTRSDMDTSFMPCPRCGRLSMDAKPIRNALSRHANVYVCNVCGMDEALRDHAQTVLPLEKWSFVALSEAMC